MSIPRVELPPALNAEITTADGTRYQWGPDRPSGDRFKGLNFSTAIGEGFSSGGVSLSRPADRDYADVKLLNKATFFGADGSVAYEGRMAAIPRDVSTSGHSVGITLAGLMANASDRKFAEVYVDRDLGGWGAASLARKNALLVGGYNPTDGSSESDVATATAGLITGWDGAWVTFFPRSELWYDAGPECTIGKITFSWLRQSGGVDNANTNFSWYPFVCADDAAATFSLGTEQRAAGPSSSSFTPTPHYRFGVFQLSYNAGSAGADGSHFGIAWYNVAVYGAHGLTLYTGEPGQPSGVLARDVITDIVNRFCPQLTIGDLAADNYVIQHLSFKDGITPFEAMQQVNKYHLRNLAVWEDGRLDWQAFDLSDYDWQVRMGVDCEISLQGASTDNVYNGIVVRYDDVLTGRSNSVTPDTNPTQLVDANPDNPWNQQGIKKWLEIDLSYPSTAGGAVQAGIEALGDANRAKSPGSIATVGYVRDRAGNRQPGWKVRAGDTIAIVNHPNDAPRLIHETTWDDDAKTQTMSVDAPPSQLDAQQDRVLTALKARGLIS